MGYRHNKRHNDYPQKSQDTNSTESSGNVISSSNPPAFPQHFPWNHVGVSVIGSEHQRNGRPCDDYNKVEPYKDNLILLAADGAGSVKFAAQGAQLAVTEAFTKICEHLDKKIPLDDILKLAAIHVRHVLERLVLDTLSADDHFLPKLAKNSQNQKEFFQRLQREFSNNLANFSSTFLVAIITPNEFGALQVGDGYIAIQLANGKMETIFEPIKNKYEYENDTFFITSPLTLDQVYFDSTDSQIQISVRPLKGIMAAALFTDGCNPLAMNLQTGKLNKEFFQTPFSTLKLTEQGSQTYREGLEKYLNSPKVNHYTNDDKTLVLAVNREAKFRPYNEPIQKLVKDSEQIDKHYNPLLTANNFRLLVKTFLISLVLLATLEFLPKEQFFLCSLQDNKNSLLKILEGIKGKPCAIQKGKYHLNNQFVVSANSYAIRLISYHKDPDYEVSTAREPDSENELWARLRETYNKAKNELKPSENYDDKGNNSQNNSDGDIDGITGINSGNYELKQSVMILPTDEENHWRVCKVRHPFFRWRFGSCPYKWPTADGNDSL